MRTNPGKATPLRWLLRRYVFLAVAVFLIAFAVFPMQGMIRILGIREGFGNPLEPVAASTAAYCTRELTLNFVYSPLNLEMLCGLFGAMGFACAMVLFRHQFSRKQALMYAGLPMTRTRSFALRSAVYGICGLLPLTVCLVIHPLMVQANGLGRFFDLRAYALRGVSTLLISLYGYAVGALCSMVFGTFWSAALGGVLIVGSVEIALGCWINIAGWYLNTLYVNGAVRDMLRFSPVWSLYKSFYQPADFRGWPGILMILVLGALTWVMCRRVRPENAGHTLNLKRAEPAVTAWTAVLGGTAGAIVLSLYLSLEPVAYLGLILGTLLVWILVRMLLDQRVRLNLKDWRIPAAAAAVMLLACFALRGDWLGFDRYTARPEELRAVEVWPDMTEKNALRFDTPESLKASLEWVDRMREEELESHRETPYENGRYADCVVAFQKKDGSRVLRRYHYPREKEGLLPALRIMAKAWGRQQSEEVPLLERAGSYSATGDFGMTGAEFTETYGFNPDSSRLLRLDPAKLREALRQDLRERTLESMQQPVVLWAHMEGAGLEGDPDSYEYVSYGIRPGDRHTLELILGEEADKWTDFVLGGFARSEEVLVFLCRYTQREDGEEKLESYERLETEEEIRTWMARVIRCDESFFAWPKDPEKRLAVYSIPSLRNQTAYNDVEIDLEDPAVRERLPEKQDLWGTYYDIMSSDL